MGTTKRWNVSSEKVTSTHHQCQFPWRVNHRLLAFSNTKLSSHYGWENVDYEAITAMNAVALHVIWEPEVVYYPDIKGLAIQYHPEYMDRESFGFKYAVDLINIYAAPHIRNKVLF